MDAGLVIYNNANSIQITSSFRNYEFISKGVAAVGALIPINNNQLIAFAPSVGNWFSGYWDDSSHHYTYGNFRGIAGAQTNYPVCGSAVIPYYIFGLSQTVGKCFEVRDSLGNIVFSDGAKYMKVLASRSGLDSTVQRVNNCPGHIVDTYAYNANLKIAILPNQLSQGIQVHAGALAIQNFTLNSNGSISSSYSMLHYDGSASYGSSTSYIQNYSYLVLDVTNL